MRLGLSPEQKVAIAKKLYRPVEEFDATIPEHHVMGLLNTDRETVRGLASPDAARDGNGRWWYTPYSVKRCLMILRKLDVGTIH